MTDCHRSVQQPRIRHTQKPGLDGAVSNAACPQHLIGMNASALIPLVGPDFCAVGGSGRLGAIVGAQQTYGLIVAVLVLVTWGATWAIASSTGSWQAAGKAETGLFLALERRRPHWPRNRVGQRTSGVARPRRSPSGTTSTAGSWCRTTAPRRNGLLLGLSPPTIPQSGSESPQTL